MHLGVIITGSLAEGFTMRIAPEALSRVKIGKFVTIVTAQARYCALLTDISLHSTSPDIAIYPPTPHENLLKKTLKIRDLYATALVKPVLVLENKQQAPRPVKTIPDHFSPVFEATADDISQIFGAESDLNHPYFNIGVPLDMTTPVCVNLERLTERSSGIFGKTGTGKTFITRLTLAGLITRDTASVLIFDMHSEYGLHARQEGSHNSFVRGLKSLFPDKVLLCSLDPQATRRRGVTPDITITIPYNSITIDDIMALQEELSLHTTALEAAYLIGAKYKQEWLKALLESGSHLKEFAHAIGAHPESIAALYRKLSRISELPFVDINNSSPFSALDNMLENIAQGKSIIIEFGNFTSVFCYLLVANIITRKIHHEYVNRTEKFLGSQKACDTPRKLIITIEEAHKFLNPAAARQTIFGTIAREMRKYYVSLLIVDQRPSGIDTEIMSQIGTKIVAQLHDERDINSVLTGVANTAGLKALLATLDSKQQAVILGHAVPMPVLIQTRLYNEQFYRDIGKYTLDSTTITQLSTEIYQ